ncbi:MAG: 50S ribosomal protein L9 [Candidatus Hydrogenedentota bacterium]
MQVLLIKDYSNLGRAGESLKVKDGYARNFLIPRKIAVPATKSNIRKYEAFIKKMEKIRQKEIKSSEDLKTRLEGMKLYFKEKASEEGRLFGSVGVAQVVSRLKEEGIELDKYQVIIPVHIKEAGTYAARIRLYHNIEANIEIVVETEKEEAPPEELAFKPETPQIKEEPQQPKVDDMQKYEKDRS